MREEDSGDFPRPGVLRDITNTEEAKSRGWSHRRKNDVARERWQMLAKALLKPKKTWRTVKEISVRRFSSFELFIPTKLDKLETAEGCWLKYAAKVHNKVYYVEVHHLEQKLTAKDLVGFNNTGNICIWPSEEVLAFYVLSHVRLFAGKEVLEVGGGMTSLAGLVLAKYGGLRRADLTDGNLASVDNVRDIIRRNRLDDANAASFRLDWTDHSRLAKKYDVVLSSDCLFFDETRADLADTIWKSLKDDGVALVVAPKRGATLDSFVEIAAERGFCCLLQSYYSETVWRQHLKFKRLTPEYDEDLHYPVLLLLTKSSQGFPLSYLLRTDYWVSQGRKFCEFCKCSIADNKPSIQFHESGKKHKENVAKRITEMQKKAAKEAKAAVDFEREMKRVEAAALKAYMNDVKSNADYTSHLIQSGVETLPTPEYVEPEPKPKSGKKKPDKKGGGKKWMEAVSEEGKSYYWNVETGESVWEKPAEGFLSVADQKKQETKSKPSKGPYKGKKHKKLGKGNFGKKKPKPSGEKGAEEKAKIEIPMWLPLTSRPYGKWKKVEEPKRKPVDLQLPRQEFVEIVVPKAKEESVREFKEKTSAPGSVVSVQGETGFKKRKIASDSRKNIRQRIDDD